MRIGKRKTLQNKIAVNECTVLDLSLWISGVLNDVFRRRQRFVSLWFFVIPLYGITQNDDDDEL